jgi:hypothetical protein
VVIRDETRHSETSQQVVQVVDTMQGGWNLLDAIADQHLDTLPWDDRENRPAYSGTDADFGLIIRFVAVLVLIVLGAILAVVLFGGDGDSESAADDPGGEIIDGAGEPADAGLPDPARADQAAPAGDEADTPQDQGEAVAGPPTPEELEAQDPIPLTDGPWRIFVDPSESAARWDMTFLGGGACSIPGDPSVVSCTYVEDSPAVEITLDRHDEPRAENADGDVRIGEVDWSEWFHLTRVGNAMYGPWEVESWMFSYDRGLERRGSNVILRETAFIRPVHPADP